MTTLSCIADGCYHLQALCVRATKGTEGSAATENQNQSERRSHGTYSLSKVVSSHLVYREHTLALTCSCNVQQKISIIRNMSVCLTYSSLTLYHSVQPFCSLALYKICFHNYVYFTKSFVNILHTCTCSFIYPFDVYVSQMVNRCRNIKTFPEPRHYFLECF